MLVVPITAVCDVVRRKNSFRNVHCWRSIRKAITYSNWTSQCQRDEISIKVLKRTDLYHYFLLWRKLSEIIFYNNLQSFFNLNQDLKIDFVNNNDKNQNVNYSAKYNQTFLFLTRWNRKTFSFLIWKLFSLYFHCNNVYIKNIVGGIIDKLENAFSIFYTFFCSILFYITSLCDYIYENVK